MSKLYRIENSNIRKQTMYIQTLKINFNYIKTHGVVLRKRYY